MTNAEAFAARLARIQEGGPNTKRTIFVGQEEQVHLAKKAVVKEAKSRKVASNAQYALSLAGAFLLGFVAVAFSRYATFHLASAYTDAPGSLAELVISAGVALCAAFVLSQLFRLGSKQHQALQGVGVLVMSCIFHNLIHWFPAPAETAFSPSYVAGIVSTSPPNSFRLGSRYFALDMAVSDSPDATYATAAAEEAEPAINRVELQHSKQSVKESHKSVKASP